MLKVLLALAASDGKSVCFQFVPGIWTNEEKNLNSTNRNKSCGNLGDLHQSCWLISPSHFNVWSGRKYQSESRWQKMQFTSDQNAIIKRGKPCEVTSRWLYIPLLGLYPAYLPEILHFCLRMADSYSSLPNCSLLVSRNATLYSLNTVIVESATWNFQNLRCL